MFSKGDGASGSAHMFAAALKMIGIQPEVIEQLSKGLLTDLKTVAGFQAEQLARAEFILRCLPPPQSMDECKSAWEAYLAVRRAEHERAFGSDGDGSGNRPAIGAPSGPGSGVG